LENQSNDLAPGSANAAADESFQKHWFCVALYPSGNSFKQDADSPTSFLDVLSRSTVGWVDYVTDDAYAELPSIAAQLGFGESVISSLTADNPINYQDFDSEMWMRIPSIQVRQMKVTPYPLLILVRKNFVFTVHSKMVDKRFYRLRRYSDAILKKIPPALLTGDKLTKVLTRIIAATNDSNFRHLRVIEESGDRLNEDLTGSSVPREKLGHEIYNMKHALVTYMNALWDCVDVLQALRYGDAELLTDDSGLLNMLNVMTEEVKAQIDLAEHMSEVLASGLEVVQNIYNNQLQTLNNRLALVMAYLTIVGTAILIPNTLGTILSSTVFNVGPQDQWWYLILMISSTVAGTAMVFLWIRKKGWLPKKMN
jgi:magnesium transporter